MPLKGYKKTDEHIKKIVESRKKNGWWKNSRKTKQKQSEKMKGKPSSMGMLGKHHTKESKEKMRIGNINKKRTTETRKKISESLSGDKHPNWQGGKSFEPYSVDWTETLKRSIRERDNYICQLCSQYGNIIHHKDNNKLNCNPDNLITFCRKCHAKIHKKDKNSF